MIVSDGRGGSQSDPVRRRSQVLRRRGARPGDGTGCGPTIAYSWAIGSEVLDPRVIGLTGTCSVGKSTTARALQRLLPGWRSFEVDRAQPTGDPLRVTGSESDTRLSELLEIDQALRRANMKAARAYVDEGFRLLVEMDLSGEWAKRTWSEVFAGILAPVILLTADPSTLRRRVRAREDRSDSPLSHDDWPQSDYALCVATDRHDPDSLARAILRQLRTGLNPA
jgi:broad-specificity NMP kinase